MKEIKLALENYSKDHAWVTNGQSIGWLDGDPLRGTFRLVAVTNAPHSINFNNPNAENDTNLITNAPEWLASLVSKVEKMQSTLEWYANKEKYEETEAWIEPYSLPQFENAEIWLDKGELARQALKDFD